MNAKKATTTTKLVRVVTIHGKQIEISKRNGAALIDLVIHRKAGRITAEEACEVIEKLELMKQERYPHRPHSDYAGYLSEKFNQLSRGYVIILDCKLAEEQGAALVEDYKEEGGRYQVLCDKHSTIVHCTNMPTARACRNDATAFCDICRDLAGEGDGTALAFFNAEQERMKEL